MRRNSVSSAPRLCLPSRPRPLASDARAMRAGVFASHAGGWPTGGLGRRGGEGECGGCLWVTPCHHGGDAAPWPRAQGAGGTSKLAGAGRTNRGYVDGAEAWPLSQLPYLATPLSLSLQLFGSLRLRCIQSKCWPVPSSATVDMRSITLNPRTTESRPRSRCRPSCSSADHAQPATPSSHA